MVELVLRLYDSLRSRRSVFLLILFAATAILALLVARQTYKEDISDFLPLDKKYSEAMKVYQGISGADRIVAVFQYRDSTVADPDSIVAAIDSFVETLREADDCGVASSVTYQIDMEKIAEVSDYVYQHIPYFLTDGDYRRIDSLLSKPDFVSTQIAQDRQMLLFPVSSILSDNLQRDPLNLFTPVVARLQGRAPNMSFENYDGYIFSPDMSRALVTMVSPYGSSETEKNGRLIEKLDSCAAATMAAVPSVGVHLIGGPIIAVGNASQIKTDSILSVVLSVFLIVLLLYLFFRRFRSLLLIVLSISWGWLFAVGTLSIFHDGVSVIVIGISSVILGIAVNYPLHLIAHMQHTPDIKTALKEIVMPLVVGNVTTVGAFLTLVPLKSVALRDLGLFSALLLVGTILFVLVFLPHLVGKARASASKSLLSFGDFSLENKRWVVVVTFIMTGFLAYYSFGMSFDSDISHINYMTPQQRADMAYFSSLSSPDTTGRTVYVVSTGETLDAAVEMSEKIAPSLDSLVKTGVVKSSYGCEPFVSSETEQRRRLGLWADFVGKHKTALRESVAAAAAENGFRPGTFDEFFATLESEYEAQDPAHFKPLIETVFTTNVRVDTAENTYNVVSLLTVPESSVESVVARIDALSPGSFAFDIRGMNSTITSTLSADFNYIGWACGLIVFLFLWFSLGSVELSMLSFLPMALSWLWILGIMTLLDIQFNVVNIILATFIFGQGDDYTIFMTEGCQFEYAHRRKMLSSYKNSIIISALIMFIGIGTLIFAKHPALLSLAEVTIVGMFSVVLMAYLLPPLIFGWLVKTGGEYRLRPLSIRVISSTICAGVTYRLFLAYAYLVGFFRFTLATDRQRAERRPSYRRLVSRGLRFCLGHISGVELTYRQAGGAELPSGACLVCRRTSSIDALCIMSLSPSVTLVVVGEEEGLRLPRRMAAWAGVVTVADISALDESSLGGDGKGTENVALLVSGDRLSGVVESLTRRGRQIVPVHIHGADHVAPRDSRCLFPGRLTIYVGMPVDARVYDYAKTYTEVRRQTETTTYFESLVVDRYRYKGYDITTTVRRSLSRHAASPVLSEHTVSRTVLFVNAGYGELALLFALANPEVEVIALVADDDALRVGTYSAETLVSNLEFIVKTDSQQFTAVRSSHPSLTVFLFTPTSADLAVYSTPVTTLFR